MKNTHLLIMSVLVIIFLSCSKTDNKIDRYANDYIRYQPQVENLISKIPKPIKDSMNLILDYYNFYLAVMSCDWCVVEGETFQSVSNFCNRYPQAVSVYLDRTLVANADGRFKYGFRVLYKEHFSDSFYALLQAYNIPFKPESELLTEKDRLENKIKEYELPYGALVEKFLNINK